MLAERLALVDELRPLLAKAYEAVARGASREDATMTTSRASTSTPARARPSDLTADRALLAEVARRRNDELDRGISLVGPHRDDLSADARCVPVKGYASHGESWSFALALKLASYELLRSNGTTRC